MKKILFLHGLESKPGGSKAVFLKSLGYEVLNPWLPANNFKKSLEIAQNSLKEDPDIIVGSSRGGALALALEIHNVPLILIAPAWKRVVTTVSPTKYFIPNLSNGVDVSDTPSGKHSKDKAFSIDKFSALVLYAKKLNSLEKSNIINVNLNKYALILMFFLKRQLLQNFIITLFILNSTF